MSQQRDRIEMAIDEIKAPLLRMDDDAVERLAAEVLAARRIVIYAMGRELLSLRAFGMRLVHHGLDAHIAGDVTALPVTDGDLVIISAGPGDLTMAEAMAGLVKKSGARLAVITAQPQGAVPRMADSVYVIPAQTMANDVGSIQQLLETLTKDTQNLLTQQARTITELQNGLMRTRMVPFQRHVQRLARIVRQAATDTHKKAELQIEGASGELDRQVLERMMPPFEHMLRNAVAHGIEAPDVRKKNGKNETGITKGVKGEAGAK